MLVTAAAPWKDHFYEIDDEKMRELLKLPVDEREGFFREHAKSVNLPNDETDFYYDLSGNQSAKLFWESEGEENLKDTLGI